jgi:hypothetical protein
LFLAGLYIKHQDSAVERSAIIELYISATRSTWIYKNWWRICQQIYIWKCSLSMHCLIIPNWLNVSASTCCAVCNSINPYKESATKHICTISVSMIFRFILKIKTWFVESNISLTYNLRVKSAIGNISIYSRINGITIMHTKCKWLIVSTSCSKHYSSWFSLVSCFVITN